MVLENRQIIVFESFKWGFQRLYYLVSLVWILLFNFFKLSSILPLRNGKYLFIS